MRAGRFTTWTITAVAALALAVSGQGPAAQADTADWFDPGYTSWTADAYRNDVVVDAAGRSLVLRDSGDGTVSVARLLPGGGIDPSYGTAGVAALPADSSTDHLVLDGDGVAVLSTTSAGLVRLTRLTATGTRDASFGTAGTVSVLSTTPDDASAQVSRRGDGGFVVGITVSIADGYSTSVIALTATGAPDTTWGTGGTLVVPGQFWRVTADGRNVLASGYTEDDGAVLRRYLPTGTLDPAFSGDGVLPVQEEFNVHQVTVQAGAYYLTGALENAQTFASRPVVARLSTAGVLDTSFGTAGYATSPERGCNPGGYQALVTGGFVYMLDRNSDCGESRLYIHRFTSTGALDTGYGVDGELVVQTWQDVDVIGGRAAVRPDGRIVLALRTLAYDEAADEETYQVSTVLLTTTATPSVTTPGAFVPLSPVRILDTRYGNGAPKGAVAPNASITLTVAGRGGVPADAAAVVMNVTVVSPTATCAVTVYPSGAPLPTTSNINCPPGRTVPNLVTVKLGTGGKVVLRNGSTGTSQLLADVAGYYRPGTATAAGAFVPLAPSRILDTRYGNGAPAAPVAAGGSLDLTVAGRGDVPATGVSAVVLNLTAVAPRALGVVTAYPSGTTAPGASNLNFTAGQTLANLATVKLGTGGRITLENGSAGTTQLLADVAGYYLGGTPTLKGTYVALTPARILDTRTGTGAPKRPLAAGETLRVDVGGRGGLPATGIGALVVNTTVTQPRASGVLTAFPSGTELPTASNLNYSPGQTVANLVVVSLRSGSAVDLRNGSAGTTHVLADAAGWFRG